MAMTHDEWLQTLCAEFDLPAPNADLLLDLTRDIAHGIARPAGPLTCFLAGVLVGQGADPAEVVARIRALLPPSASD